MGLTEKGLLGPHIYRPLLDLSLSACGPTVTSWLSSGRSTDEVESQAIEIYQQLSRPLSLCVVVNSHSHGAKPWQDPCMRSSSTYFVCYTLQVSIEVEGPRDLDFGQVVHEIDERGAPCKTGSARSVCFLRPRRFAGRPLRFYRSEAWPSDNTEVSSQSGPWTSCAFEAETEWIKSGREVHED